MSAERKFILIDRTHSIILTRSSKRVVLDLIDDIYHTALLSPQHARELADALTAMADHIDPPTDN